MKSLTPRFVTASAVVRSVLDPQVPAIRGLCILTRSAHSGSNGLFPPFGSGSRPALGPTTRLWWKTGSKDRSIGGWFEGVLVVLSQAMCWVIRPDSSRRILLRFLINPVVYVTSCSLNHFGFRTNSLYWARPLDVPGCSTTKRAL